MKKKKKEKNSEREIIIEHLGYAVELKDITKCDDVLPNGIMMVERVNSGRCILWCGFPIKTHDFPAIVHEVTHITQFIAIDYSIDMYREKEHMAYIAQYLFGEIIGYPYIIK